MCKIVLVPSVYTLITLPVAPVFACVIVSPYWNGVLAFDNVVLIWYVGLFPLNLITALEPAESDPPVLIDTLPGSPYYAPPGFVNVIDV